jgi:uncharacterized membrane protein
MEDFARDVVDTLIPIVELIGALVIGVGVLVTFAAYVLSELRIRPRPYEAIRLLLGRFLALGLEFQLASDILGTAVSPTFAEIGKLAAIAAIRTLLNYFLAQEIERAQRVVEHERGDATHPAARRHGEEAAMDRGARAGPTGSGPSS